MIANNGPDAAAPGAAPRRLYYGWIVVAIAALISILGGGIRSAPGVFMVSIEREMGWARATVSLAVAFGILVFGFTAPFSGQLMSRFGPRRVVLAGLVVLAASMASSAVMTQLWQLNLLWGALSGIGTGLIGSVLGAAVTNRWFVSNRGLVTGIFGAATSAGQLIFIPGLTALAQSLGWRNSSWLIAALPIAFLIPVWLLLKNDPAEIGAKPHGADASWSAQSAARPDPDIMRRALRNGTFWMLAGTFFVCGFTTNGLVGTHFIPYALGCGITAGVAASTLAMMGMFNFAGTLASGWLTDRIDPRKLLAIYYALRGVSLITLPLLIQAGDAVLPVNITLTLFAVLFGLDYIATVPPTIKLCADVFGRENVGVVYGWVFCAHMVGAAMASWLGGVAYDALGSYLMAFVLAGFVAIVASLIAVRIRRPANATLLPHAHP